MREKCRLNSAVWRTLSALPFSRFPAFGIPVRCTGRRIGKRGNPRFGAAERPVKESSVSVADGYPKLDFIEDKRFNCEHDFLNLRTIVLNFQDVRPQLFQDVRPQLSGRLSSISGRSSSTLTTFSSTSRTISSPLTRPVDGRNSELLLQPNQTSSLAAGTAPVYLSFRPCTGLALH